MDDGSWSGRGHHQHVGTGWPSRTRPTGSCSTVPAYAAQAAALDNCCRPRHPADIVLDWWSTRRGGRRLAGAGSAGVRQDLAYIEFDRDHPRESDDAAAATSTSGRRQPGVMRDCGSTRDTDLIDYYVPRAS